MKFKNKSHNNTMNKSEKKEIFKQFIDTYFELLEVIKTKLDHHKDFKVFYLKNYALRKTNIKLFIKTWYESITCLYYTRIINGDIQYFLDNGASMMTTNTFKEYFDYFKKIYKTLDNTIVNSVKSMVQRLTQASFMYYN